MQLGDALSGRCLRHLKEFPNPLQERLFFRFERGASRQNRVEPSVDRRLVFNRPSLRRRHIVKRYGIG
jgi:hypothetical protein